MRIRRDRGRRRRWAGRGHSASGLSLTSLMDFLTCLLFFVLKSFVAGGESTVPPPGLTLPSSTAEVTCACWKPSLSSRTTPNASIMFFRAPARR